MPDYQKCTTWPHTIAYMRALYVAYITNGSIIEITPYWFVWLSYTAATNQLVVSHSCGTSLAFLGGNLETSILFSHVQRSMARLCSIDDKLYDRKYRRFSLLKLWVAIAQNFHLLQLSYWPYLNSSQQDPTDKPRENIKKPAIATLARKFKCKSMGDLSCTLCRTCKITKSETMHEPNMS